MTFERFSRPYNLLALLLCGAVMLPSHIAMAQDSGYAPPAMFEDATPPMVRPQGDANGYIVAPKASGNTQLPAQTAPRAPIILPRVSIDPDSPRSSAAPTTAPIPVPAPSPAPVIVPAPAPVVTAPTPPPAVTAPLPAPTPPPPVVIPTPPAAPATVAPAKPKMMAPIVEDTYIKREKPAAKKEIPAKSEEPRTEPVKKPAPTPSPSKPSAPVAPESYTQPSSSSEAPIIKPVQRDPSQSAIKGPKTMPALPTEAVDEQVIFDAKEETPQTIMERHQQETRSKKKEGTLTPIVPAPNPNVTPTAFDPGEQGVLKKSIPFNAGQIGLTAADADPIIAGVVKELDQKDKEDWRVQIRAFATPHGAGLSSDRRIALSRALSLRSSMITQGVAASRIDVMAEGLQTDPSKPGDRIDLYLFGPPAQ